MIGSGKYENKYAMLENVYDNANKQRITKKKLSKQRKKSY